MFTTLSTLMKKVALGVFTLCFAFTMVYVPQVTPKPINTAYAVFPTADAPAFGQRLWDNITQTAQAAYGYVSSYFDGLQFNITSVLNGIAWAAAKRVLSMIQRDIVRWINSGFRGSPAFIQDFQGFMSNVADQVLGQVITDLGGGFLCSPFRINVQIAIQTSFYRSQYRQSRSCSLTQIGNNLQNFANDMTQGGWNTWFSIVHQPGTYTEYGSTLEALSDAGYRIQMNQNSQTLRLNWGRGFLSSEVCDETPRDDGTTERSNCRITTPGDTIAAQLNSVVQYGGESLIAADEINEIIGALMEQFLTMALTGAAGLLGMGGGSYQGYTQDSFNASLTNTGNTPNNFSVNTQSTQWGSNAALENGRQTLVDALARERAYLALAQEMLKRYPTAFATGDYAANYQQIADRFYSEAVAGATRATSNITQLESMIAEFDAASTEIIRDRVINRFASLAPSLTQASQLEIARNSWLQSLASMDVITEDMVRSTLAVETRYRSLAQWAVTTYQNGTYSTTEDGTNSAQDAYNEASELLPELNELITNLTNIVATFDTFDTTGDGGALRTAASAYRSWRDGGLFHSSTDVSSAESRWESALGETYP